MKIAILGATGRTGRALMQRSRRSETIEPTAVARDARRADAEWVVRIADGRDVDALAAAVAGQDAVVFAIGPVAGESDATVMRESMTATLEGMRRAGVDRLVAVSASGPFVAGDDQLTRYLAKPILRRVLRDAFADLVATEDVVRASTARWTIVRPPMLTDANARGRYRSRADGNVPWGFRIARADLALALIDAVEKDDTVGETISVAR